jgi:LPS export ABC transporter protein LptC
LKTTIAFVCLCASLLFWYGCENDTNEVKKVSERKVYPIEIMRNANILYSEEALIKVNLKAPLIHKYGGAEPYNEMPEGIDVTFYDSLMNVTTHITALYAIDKIGENRMEARNDVVVVNEKKEQLNTEHLVWDRKNAIIYSNEFVKVTTEDEIIMGEGFESNQEFTKYKIKKPKGTLSREDD